MTARRKGDNYNEMLEHQKQLESRIHVQNDSIDKLKRANTELKREVHILTGEKNELLNRLSKIAGEQMSRNNPDIADLSDPNRPTKLAERWSTLYTEEWMDAYEELNKNRRKSLSQPIEKHLVEIAELCYQECQETADQQIMRLKASLEDLENYMQNLDCNLNLSLSRKSPKNPRFVDNVIHTYKQRRRQDQGWIQAVVKKCANQYISKNGVHSQKILSYVKKCAELCWYMCVNEPRMVLECESHPGLDIDKNKFNLYSGKGTKIDYIVWPALYLQKAGELCILSKGVVQPIVQQESKLPKRNSPEKMDGTVTPASIYDKKASVIPRAPSATSKREAKTQPTSPTLLKKHSNVSHNSDVVTSRIANPDRLLTSKKQDKLHTNKPLQYSLHKQKDFSKSMKGRSIIV